MTTENNKKESEWDKPFEDPNESSVESLSEIEALAEKIRAKHIPNGCINLAPHVRGKKAYKIEKKTIRAAMIEFANELAATSIEGEIKSKEGVLEDFVGVLPVKFSLSQYAQIYRAMEAYASQFTASKEKEYRGALQKIKDRADNGEITGTVFELDKDLSEIYTIATEALNK